METGMLWFDNNPNLDLFSKISQAIDYYRQKYGEDPNLCFVHPSVIQSINGGPTPIKILPNNRVIKNHFWIGVQTKNNSLT
jgi:hypothetical protein